MVAALAALCYLVIIAGEFKGGFERRDAEAISNVELQRRGQGKTKLEDLKERAQYSRILRAISLASGCRQKPLSQLVVLVVGKT